jgi:hypothetical protein
MRRRKPCREWTADGKYLCSNMNNTHVILVHCGARVFYDPASQLRNGNIFAESFDALAEAGFRGMTAARLLQFRADLDETRAPWPGVSNGGMFVAGLTHGMSEIMWCSNFQKKLKPPKPPKARLLGPGSTSAHQAVTDRRTRPWGTFSSHRPRYPTSASAARGCGRNHPAKPSSHPSHSAGLFG